MEGEEFLSQAHTVTEGKNTGFFFFYSRKDTVTIKNEGERKEEGGGEGKEDEKEEENSEGSALHSLMHHSRSCIHRFNTLEWNFILK